MAENTKKWRGREMKTANKKDLRIERIEEILNKIEEEDKKRR